VEKVIEIELTSEEKSQFDQSLSHVQESVAAMDRVLGQG